MLPRCRRRQQAAASRSRPPPRRAPPRGLPLRAEVIGCCTRRRCLHLAPPSPPFAASPSRMRHRRAACGVLHLSSARCRRPMHLLHAVIHRSRAESNVPAHALADCCPLESGVRCREEESRAASASTARQHTQVAAAAPRAPHCRPRAARRAQEQQQSLKGRGRIAAPQHAASRLMQEGRRHQRRLRRCCCLLGAGVALATCSSRRRRRVRSLPAGAAPLAALVRAPAQGRPPLLLPAAAARCCVVHTARRPARSSSPTTHSSARRSSRPTRPSSTPSTAGADLVSAPSRLHAPLLPPRAPAALARCTAVRAP
jgi:hypothetical protein